MSSILERYKNLPLAEAKKEPSQFRILKPTQNDPETFALWQKWVTDPDIRKYMFGDMAQSPEEIHEWLEIATMDPTRHYFTITHEGNKVGFVSIRQDQFPPTTGEVGIVIGEKDLQGKRIGTQALKEVLDFAQEGLHLTQLRALIKPENIRSKKLFARAGFSDTGVITINGTKMHRFERNFPISTTETARERANILLDELDIRPLHPVELLHIGIDFSRELSRGGRTKDPMSTLLMEDAKLPSPDPEKLKARAGKPVLVVEIGGTNVRVAIGQINADGQPVLRTNADQTTQKIETSLTKTRFGSPDELYQSITDLIRSHPEFPLPDTMPDRWGIIWSFESAVEQTPLGIDTRSSDALSKDLEVVGLSNERIGESILRTLKKEFWPTQALPDGFRLTVINDTPAVLFSYVPPEKSNQIGIADGTGFNIAASLGRNTYNLEAGNFSPIPSSPFLDALDKTYTNTGKYQTEKQTSGKYIGDQFNALVDRCIRESVISVPKSDTLDTGDMTRILTKNYAHLSQKFSRPLSHEDRLVLFDIASRLRDRSATIVGLLAGTIVRSDAEGFSSTVVVPVEGSYFVNNPGMDQIASSVASVIAQRPVILLGGKDLGLRGAIAAASS